MSAMKDTSQPKAVDPVSVLIGSTLDTSTGSAVFSGLENGRVSLGELARYIRPHEGASPLAAEKQDGSTPVAGEWAEDLMELCSWCGFMMKFGRGPTSHGICNICRIEFFPEVPHAHE